MDEASTDVDELVATAAAAAFPDRSVAEWEAAGPSWNDDNHTVAVTFRDGERAYLKVAADGDGSRAARERAVVDYVAANADVPVPEIVACDPTGEVPYVATAPVDGTSGLEHWSDGDDDERVAFLRDVGRSLASVHANRFDEHGHVIGGDRDGLELDTATWTDVLVDTIEATREQAGPGRFDGHFEDVLATVDANRDRLDEAPTALLHGDPARPNAFVQEPTEAGTRVGFLDWELAHVGDPVRELQRARRQQVEGTLDCGDDEHVQAFYDGYRERAGGLPDGFEDRRAVYDAVTYLGTSAFFEKWTDWFDEPTAELAARVEEEMQRRLDGV